jgi:hypothetical protein
LKISPLLAQYLYTNGKLDLPGIGTFLLDNPSVIPVADNKNKPALLEGVSFQQNKQTKEDPELIAYISAQSGKIKPLASADLESHLELAKQFLNMGKPFLFEGIGTLSQKGSEYSFTSGAIITEPVREHFIKEAVQQHTDDNSGYDGVFYSKSKKQRKAWKKPLVALLVLAGIGLAIWGGYTVYKNTSKNKENDTADEKNVLPEIADTIQSAQNSNTNTNTKKDTINIVTQASATTTAPTGSYKFILEKADSTRAYSRYSRLQKFGWNVTIEKLDSASYRLYILLPSNTADSSRVIDSLSRLTGKRVYIER